MHTVIENILEESRSRLAEPKDRMERAGKIRDLRESARAVEASGRTPVIAEIKPKALGREMTPAEVEKQARLYESSGACAVSVLTEPTYFKGSLQNVNIAREATGLPVLRKDFILDVRQMDEVGADHILLIASILTDLGAMIDSARARGMEPLVEVHREDELLRALKSGAEIIGINNRDFDTLQVHLTTFERLAPLAKDAGVFLVAESGVQTAADAKRMIEAGADALLVGTSVMQEPSRLAALVYPQIHPVSL